MKLFDLIKLVKEYHNKYNDINIFHLECGKTVTNIIPSWKRNINEQNEYLIFEHNEKFKSEIIINVIYDLCSYYRKYGNIETGINDIKYDNNKLIIL